MAFNCFCDFVHQICESNVCAVSLLVLLGGILYTLWLNIKYRSLPPHPFILPYFGNAFFVMGKRPVEQARQMKDSHGKVAKLTCFTFPGDVRFVLLNDVATVRKVFIQESEFTSDRPANLVLLTTNRPPLGIINSPPPTWVGTRRVGLQILRDLGFGRSLLQQSIEDQCDYLRDYLQSMVGQQGGFAISNTLSRCSSDIMSLMLFGRKPALEGGSDVKYVQMIERITQIDNRILLMFPFLRHFNRIPMLRSHLLSYEKERLSAMILKYLQMEINQHRDRLNASNEPNDFIDHFLVLQSKEKGKANEEVFSDENLAYTLQDLYVAGTDTTSVTLTWALALLSHRPDVQSKVYEELVSVFGPTAYPNMGQINDCPYTRAVMSEVLRFGVTAPASLPHANTKDLFVDDYWIPKDSIILANIFNISRDPALWKQPNDFYPEHFYNASSNAFVPNENFISFSIGRRACLGESLARQEFFMFLGAMIMQYRFEFHESCAGAEMEILAGRNNGVVRRPNEYLLKVHRRE